MLSTMTNPADEVEDGVGASSPPPVFWLPSSASSSCWLFISASPSLSLSDGGADSFGGDGLVGDVEAAAVDPPP